MNDQENDTQAAVVLAKEVAPVYMGNPDFGFSVRELVDFFQRARAMERERVASHFDAEPAHSAGAWIARAIRAMGEKP